MNKYKVEIIETNIYTIDVLANTEEEAKELAQPKLQTYFDNGTAHYYQTNTGDEFNTGTVFDVTNTDDPFNP